MPRIHLVTGHRQINRGDIPVVLYCGHDADAARKARDAATAAGLVLIADHFHPNSPVTRYAAALAPDNALEAFLVKFGGGPLLVKADASSGKVEIVLIPVELLEGDNKMIINVSSEKEAEMLKQMAKALVKSCAEIEKLNADKSALIEFSAASLDGAKAELALCREAFTKHEASIQAANTEADQLRADKAAAELLVEAKRLELESCVSEGMRRDQRITELEAQLAAVTAQTQDAPTDGKPKKASK